MPCLSGLKNSSNPIKIAVQGVGHPISFKNNKMLTRGRVITNPKNQKWMEQATEHIESALRCWCQINGIEIQTDAQRLSAIVTLMPLDDCLAWIEELSVNWRRVNKGEEGFEMEITTTNT